MRVSQPTRTSPAPGQPTTCAVKGCSGPPVRLATGTVEGQQVTVGVCATHDDLIRPDATWSLGR